MSEPQSVSQIVRTRMIIAFGDPHTIMGKDSHWKFQPSADAMFINVLLNGTRDNAALWVFDPHDMVNGVEATNISGESQIAPAIQSIRDRITRAAARK